MFQQLVVPIDGSAASWRAVPIAARMVAAVDGKLDVVTVADRLGDIVPAEKELRAGVARLGELPVVPNVQVLASDSVAGALAKHIDSLTGAMIAMSSHGHGRSAAVLGSTADEVLRRLFGPIIVFGPEVTASDGSLGGTYLVPVDGSQNGASIVPVAEAWSIEFGGVPWLVEVVETESIPVDDVFESAYASRLAHDMMRDTGRAVEFEVLHGRKPAKAIIDYAKQTGASLIFATTHGRSGMERLRVGSVAAGIIHDAPCPVVLNRPPHLTV